MSSSTKPAGRQPHFAHLAQPLIEADLPLPVPLTWALDGHPQPLALSTRTEWPLWAEAHGYGPDQVEQLNCWVGPLVRSPWYLAALAADLSERHDADGKPVEPVSPLDRHSAALMALERTAGKTGLPVLATPRAKRGAASEPAGGPPAAAEPASVSPPAQPSPAIVPPASPKGLGRPKLSLPSMTKAKPPENGGLSPEEQAKRIKALRTAMNVVAEGR